MGKRKVPIVKTYYIRYVSDVLVRATNTKEAYARGDECMLSMMEDESMQIDDIFTITMESENFHIAPEDTDDDDDEDEDMDTEVDDLDPDEDEDEGEDE